ncbi:MAG: ABC transporter substrate-binding protein [Planctomycetes bacterium]|nr:ABC transporter substrate-binding protein [Planctomycetota bacterium]
MGLACAVLLLVALPSGCTRRGSDAPIRIAALFSLTGDGAPLGIPEGRMATLLADEINERGGIRGAKVELIVRDVGDDPARAAAALRELAADSSIIAAIGPTRTGSTLAAIPVAQAAEIPLISCAAAETIVKPVSERRWIFKVAPNDRDAAVRILEHMRARGLDRIGLLTGMTAFGEAGRVEIRELAPQMGVEIVADETYPADAEAFDAALDRIRRSGARAILNWSIVRGQTIVPQDMRRLGIDLPLYQSHGFANEAFIAACGPAAEGTVFPASPVVAPEVLPDDDARKAVCLRYRDAYRARYGEPASAFGGHAYDALRLLFGAIEAAGTDRARIRAALERQGAVAGTAGVFRITPEDHSGLTKECFLMFAVRGGRFVLATGGR